MPKTELFSDTSHTHRVEDLEARVGWLETAVAQMKGEPVVRRLPTSPTTPPPAAARSGPPQNLTLTQRLMAVTQPLSQLIPAAPLFPGTPAATTSSILENMGFTAAFASLDAKVEEASVAECMLAPLKLSDSPVLSFDASVESPPLPPVSTHAGDTLRLKTLPTEVRALIEDQYPSILQRITGTWRTPEVAAYLRKLILDERGTRSGFDPEVMSDLLLLSAMLEEVKAPVAPGGWGRAA